VFSSLLKELRSKNRITQSELAKNIGVSTGNVSDWESGRSKPGYTALSELSRFFEVSADYLLELNMPPVKTEDRLSTYKAEQGLICDGSPLNEEEADLVAMYRLLPESVREDFFDQLHCLYEKYAERKRASIYWTYAADREEKEASERDEEQGGTA
jgi:transcriptional regulator with XRE-family HTH domain